MSGHVVYACACLNIKIHLANKYLLDNHNNDRAQCFIRLEDPLLEGRQFELGMGGIQAEYNTLMTTRLVGSDMSWMTVTCLNCSTGDVYSIQRPSNERRFIETYPVDVHSLYRPGDRVIIHNNTMYGHDIDKTKERQNYSHNFKIVLNTDAPSEKENEGFNNKNNIPGDLYSQHGQLRQILERSLKQMQYVTEQRIEQFRQEQFQELEKATTQAKCDRDFLWQKILEASRTVNEEKQLRKRLELDQHLENDSNSTSHVRFAPEEKNQNDSAASSYSHTLPQPPKQSATPSTSSFITPSSLRKSSFALDERVIATSWKKTNVPDHHLHNHNGLAIQENNKNENEDSELSDHDDESDGLFDLDEEIESEGEEEEKEKGTNIQTDPSLGSDKAKDKMVSSGSYLGSSLSTSVDWTKKRRKSNTKYLSTFEEDDDDDEPPNRSRFQDPSHDLLSSSVSAFATSMPIAISHNNEYINDAMKQMPNKNAVNPADQDPTTTSSSIQKNTPQDNKETALSTSSSRDIHNTTTTLTTTTTTAYDQFSFADQEASKLFPVNERRRKSIAVTGATPRPQLDSLVGQSLDTRRRSSMARNSFIADPSRHHETNSEDEQEGPMVPPHILAASTYTDETEELFGAVPRSNTWRKTYD